MFQRMIVEDWANTLSVIAFAIFGSVFLFVTYRALRLGESRRKYLESLPLDEPDSSLNSSPPNQP